MDQLHFAVLGLGHDTNFCGASRKFEDRLAQLGAHRLLAGRVGITSRRTDLEVNAQISPTVPPGQVFLPMHYDGVNRLPLAT